MSKFDKYHINRKLLKNKILLFKIIGILLPFLILLLLEISLRIFHYGNNLNLFIEYSGNKNFYVLNPNASKKYFTNQNIATTGNSELFKKEKDTNTLRIFVLGESTTIGYPYFHNGSFHRWLQYRLMHTFANKNFEIINVSLTAVNSYTVLGFAKEIVNYKPDAILIYVGHNEYYGTLGVGSTNRIGSNPFVVNLILNLRNLRLVQLMTNLYETIAVSPVANSEGTRMKMMVSEGQIPYQSKLFYKGINQFRSNMDKTLSLFSNHRIPVFISNLVSNEKDIKPFVSFPVDSIRFPEFKKNFTLGQKAFENHDWPVAYQYLEKANQIYDAHALCNYYLGRLVYMHENWGKAKDFFFKAKELDGLRYRAPEEMNKIILQLCDKYQNVHLVDTKTRFEDWPSHHIIGNELILEHVHPNSMGYALLSDAFYETMKKTHFISVNKGTEMSFKQLLCCMPFGKVDSLSGVYKILKLKRSWPFSETMSQDTVKIETEEQKIAWGLALKQISWQDAMDSVYNYYINNHDLLDAKKITEAMVLEHPEDPAFYEKAAMLSGELKDYEDAVFYFKKAFYLSPSSDKAKYLFVINLKLDKPNDAIPYLDYSIQNTNDVNLKLIRDLTEEIILLKKSHINDSSNLLTLNQIAVKYFKMGNLEGASKYIDMILKTDHKNKEALSLLARIKK